MCYIQTFPVRFSAAEVSLSAASEAQPGLVLTRRCYHPLLESSRHCWEPAQSTTQAQGSVLGEQSDSISPVLLLASLFAPVN